MKQERPEQKTNRMQRPAGPLGCEPGRVERTAWPAPGTAPARDGGGGGVHLRLGAGTRAARGARTGRPSFPLGNPRTGRLDRLMRKPSCPRPAGEGWRGCEHPKAG